MYTQAGEHGAGDLHLRRGWDAGEEGGGGQTTVYVGPHYEKNLTTGVVTTYYYLGSQRVAIRVGSVVSWIHGDHGLATAGKREHDHEQQRWWRGERDALAWCVRALSVRGGTLEQWDDGDGPALCPQSVATGDSPVSGKTLTRSCTRWAVADAVLRGRRTRRELGASHNELWLARLRPWAEATVHHLRSPRSLR